MEIMPFVSVVIAATALCLLAMIGLLVNDALSVARESIAAPATVPDEPAVAPTAEAAVAQATAAEAVDDYLLKAA